MANEKVGNVSLNLDLYPGEDFYCDGTIEDEILSIVKEHTEDEFPQIIEERKSWPILYHLSEKRENIVECLPITKKDRVLEVGSGCGAITGALSKKAKYVDCVDLSKKRSLINAYRHKDCDNIEIHVGNFKDIEPTLPVDYDYICLIGVFEYGQCYISGEHPYEDFLNILLKHLKKGGRMVIAIENRLGMKYFAGCKEDHLGTFFSGIENAYAKEGVQTFSRNALEQIFDKCGVEEYHFYYPYPDYKFPVDIYSDERLPKVGELINNRRNFDRDRMELFHETAAYNSVIEDGLYPIFSNSFMVVIGPKMDMTYARYSNDRAKEYQIKTSMEVSEQGIVVKKEALHEEGKAHIRKLLKSYQMLETVLAKGGLKLNECRLMEKDNNLCAIFPYVTGINLEEKMDQLLLKKDFEGFYELFQTYYEKIKAGDAIDYTNIDMAFANFIITDDTWTLLDYEWTSEEQIPAKELAYRAFYCYQLEDEKRKGFSMDRIKKILDISEQEMEKVRQKEAIFQKKITGKRLSMAEIRELLGGAIINPVDWLKHYDSKGGTARVQIYEDCGQGYSEENSYFVVDAYKSDQYVEFDIEVSKQVAMLRIDPAMDSCIVRIKELKWNDAEIPVDARKMMYINGKVCKSEQANCPSMIFATKDPNINISLQRLTRKETNHLHVALEVTRVSMEMAEALSQSVKKIY